MKINFTYLPVFVTSNSWSHVVRFNKTARTLSKSRREYENRSTVLLIVPKKL